MSPPTDTESASLDAMFETLARSYRRRILLELYHDNPRDEDEFTTEDVAPTEAADDELFTLKTELDHVHLPKLADHGYIEWDREAETIQRGPKFDRIAPLLRLMDEHADELPDDWP